MLRWRPSVGSKSISAGSAFLKEIVVWVFFVHVSLILFSLLYSWCTFQPKSYKIRIQDKPVTYVLMPIKGFNKQNIVSFQHDQQEHFKSKVIDYASYQKLIARDKKESASLGKKTIQKRKKEESKTILRSTKSVKQITKKIALKKQKSELKKKKEKVSVLNKKTADKIESKVATDQEPIKPVVLEQSDLESKVEQPVVQDGQELSDIALPSTVVALDPEEFAARNVQEKIRQSILEHWIAPIGMQDDTVCQLQVTINDQGEATHVKVIKKSGIYLFDVEAKKAALAALYPAESYNTTIITELGA